MEELGPQILGLPGRGEPHSLLLPQILRSPGTFPRPGSTLGRNQAWSSPTATSSDALQSPQLRKGTALHLGQMSLGIPALDSPIRLTVLPARWEGPCLIGVPSGYLMDEEESLSTWGGRSSRVVLTTVECLEDQAVAQATL